MSGLAGTPLDRVCVVMLSAIGNTVHVLPVLNALKRHHPSAHVTWIMQAGPAKLVRGHPAVDEIVLFDRKKGLRGLLELRRELRRRPFDVVLDFQTYFKAGLVTGMTRAPVKLGFDRARAKDFNWLFTTHRVPPRAPGYRQDQYLEFLDTLGVPAEPVEWRLGPWEHEREWQRAFFAPIDRPVASLVVGATKDERNWVPERWAELVDVLAGDYGLQPVLVGGSSEEERETERVIRERSRHEVVSTLGIPFREMVGVLDGSALVVSVDTGPLHVGVALGRPTVALMGHENPLHTGPARPEMRDLVVEAYFDPGEPRVASFEVRNGRTRRITVSQVVEKVDLAVRRYGIGPGSGQSAP